MAVKQVSSTAGLLQGGGGFQGATANQGATLPNYVQTGTQLYQQPAVNPQVYNPNYQVDPWAGAQLQGVDNGWRNTGGAVGGGGSTAAQQTADERAAYDDQINALNQLLGYTQTSRDQGLSSLQAGMDDEQRKLNDSKTKAMAGYDEQSVQNNKDKLGGFNQVDEYANNSYKSLQRLLSGGNAGVSSVGRELMPYLVSKSAGTRRQGVVETAGANERSITGARGTAEDEYNLSTQDLGNQRKAKEQSFLESILQRQNDLTGQKRDLEVKKAMANGTGYAAARAAGDASQASINSRMGELANLFGTYKPTYSARAMNLKTPDLSQFTVDKAVNINSDKSLPTESSYYMTQLNKKKQAEGGF